MCYFQFRMYQQNGRSQFQPEVWLQNVKEIIKNGRAIPFRWDAIPDPVRSWFQAMAGAINTQPEFLFLGAITFTLCLIEPNASLKVNSDIRRRVIFLPFASLGLKKCRLTKLQWKIH